MNASEGVRIEGIGKTFGATRVIADVSLEIAPGEIVALLGPSGCGKTTTLRCLAGLETPDEGRITIGERVLFDAATGTGVPAENRNVGLMFQSYAIWPHMTIFENVAYGLRVKRRPSEEIARRVGEALAAVNLGEKAGRFPATLSGGEQQRVALARSMVTQPSVLLMDEPLSNLDLKLRERMRLELREMLKRLGVTAVYVTHDQADAMVLADRLVIMNEGRVVEIGEPRAVYSRPRSLFASEFLGSANVIDFVETPEEGARHFGRLQDGRRLALGERPLGLRHIIRPESIELRDATHPGGENVLEGEIGSSVYLGNLTYYTVKSGGLSLLVQTNAVHFDKGDAVRAVLPAAALVSLLPEIA
jgi:iron(III) transport system ATP-binding protein